MLYAVLGTKGQHSVPEGWDDEGEPSGDKLES